MLKTLSRLSRPEADSGTAVIQHSHSSVPTLTVPVDAHDHIIGPENALVTLVEYGSYDCPHCLQALAITLHLIQSFNEPSKPGLRLVYRHFPRETRNSRSERAAEAAEAASQQGRFWEMHEHLLRRQSALDDTSLLAYAAMLKLDTRQFVSDLDTSAHEATIRAQFEGGRDSGVHSTPTFFINGLRHDGEWDPETLSEAINHAAWIARK